MSTDDTIDTLNALIECSKDGEYGFRKSAEHIRNSQTKQLLMRRADECRQSATELQALVRELGGKAEDSGTAGGAMHRGWVAIKSTLSGHSEAAILEEAERGEDSAMKSYREALSTPLAGEVRAVVERQFEGVKRNHAQMRALRDQARQATA